MKTLIVVDAQKDFMPGGSLAVEHGDEIVSVINELLPKFDLVIFTKDWHQPNMDAFASTHKGKLPFDTYQTKAGESDILWPDHCVQDTPGAMIHEGINFDKITGKFYIFKKGTEKDKHPYSGFSGTGLSEFLDSKEVTQVYITGLALDFCVKDTAIDAALNGFETSIILDGTRAIDSTQLKMNELFAEFEGHGIKLLESWELPFFALNR